MNFDFKNYIEKETNLESLNELLNRFIPMDRANLAKTSDVEIKASVRGISSEEYIEQQNKLIDHLESLIKKRIDELK